jgi:hypothetical protein
MKNCFQKKERLSVNHHSQQELLFQKIKKENRANELIISNKTLIQNEEKEKHSAEVAASNEVLKEMKLSSSSPTKSFTTIQSKSGLHGYPADQ